jgi:hypothetical protein
VGGAVLRMGLSRVEGGWGKSDMSMSVSVLDEWEDEYAISAGILVEMEKNLL